MGDDQKEEGGQKQPEPDRIELTEGGTRSGSFDDDKSERPVLIVTQPTTSSSGSGSDSDE
jgi:hypothetical protein